MTLQLLCQGRYSSSPIDAVNVSDECQHQIKYVSSIKRIKNRRMYDLQVSTMSRQTTLKCAKQMLYVVFCWVWIQRIQVKIAGVAFRLYQCRKTRASQSLLKLLEKLEESPENKREIKRETKLWRQQDTNLVPESQLRKAQNNGLTDGPSPQTVWLTRNWHHSILRSWQNPEDSSWDQTGAPETRKVIQKEHSIHLSHDEDKTRGTSMWCGGTLIKTLSSFSMGCLSWLILVWMQSENWL